MGNRFKNKRRNPDDEQVTRFIEGAQVSSDPPKEEDTGSDTDKKPEKKTIKSPPDKKKPNYPWEDPRVREDVIKQYPLRLPEPYKLKLDWVAKRKEGISSANEYLNDILIPAIDKDIRDITG